MSGMWIRSRVDLLGVARATFLRRLGEVAQGADDGVGQHQGQRDGTDDGEREDLQDLLAFAADEGVDIAGARGDGQRAEDDVVLDQGMRDGQNEVAFDRAGLASDHQPVVDGLPRQRVGEGGFQRRKFGPAAAHEEARHAIPHLAHDGGEGTLRGLLLRDRFRLGDGFLRILAIGVIDAPEQQSVLVIERQARGRRGLERGQ